MDNLARTIRTINGVLLTDTLESGIYKKPTIYVWIYKDMRNKVVSDINQLFPDTFHLFNSSDKPRNLNIENKFILKINETSLNLPIPQPVEKNLARSCKFSDCYQIHDNQVI
jgi:hypothetical protein